MTQALDSHSAAPGAALADLFDDHDALSFLAASLDASSPRDDDAMHSSKPCAVDGSEVAVETSKSYAVQPRGALLSLDCADDVLRHEQQQQQLQPFLVPEPEQMVMELAPDLDAFIEEFNLEFAQTGNAIGHGMDAALDMGVASFGALRGGNPSVPLEQGSVEGTADTTQGQNIFNIGPVVELPASGSAEDDADDGNGDDDDEWTLAKKKSIGRHSRRREELIYLRGKVQELEAKLVTLKRKQQSSSNLESESPDTSSMISTTSTTASGKQSDSMWEKVATRQLRERQRVELLNTKLRSALETQLQIAKSLERILKKRSTFEALLETSGSSKRIKHAPGPLEDDKASVFDELLGDMDRLYADVDKMLEAAGLQSETSSFCKIVVKPDPVSGLVMEIIENKLLPAEPSVAYKTMWRFAGEKGVNNSDYFEVRADTAHDVSKRSFGATFTRGCNTASFRGTQVSKKYLEESRMVIVSKSIMSSIEEPASPAHGLVFEESTWTVLSLLQNPKLSSESITLCQSSSILVPKCWGPNLKAGILTEFVTTSWEKANAARDQLVENMLLEEMSKLRI